MKCQIGVRLERDLLNQVDALAKKEHRNRSDMVRYIVAEWFERSEIEKREKEKSA